MYKISYDDYDKLGVRVVFLFDGDNQTEAYDGYNFSGQLALEIINNKSNRIYVSFDNIDKLIDDISDNQGTIFVGNEENLSLFPSSYSSKEELEQFLIEKEMSEIPTIRVSLDDVIVVDREITENSNHFFWEPISKGDNYDYCVLFNTLSISANTIISGFDFSEYLKVTDEEYGSCSYCKRNRREFKDFYKVINPDCSGFEALCGECSEIIKEKFDEISQETNVVSKVVSRKI